MDLNQLTSQIIKAAIEVHKELGPGLLESVYQRCMIIELTTMGLKVESEIPATVIYKGHVIHDEGFRIDLFVEEQIIVELKSKEEVTPVDKKQLLTYMRLKKKSVGLLINFHEALLTWIIHEDCVFIHNHFCDRRFGEIARRRSFDAALRALLKVSPERRPSGRSRSPQG